MRRSLFGFFVLAILCLRLSAHAGAPREIVVAIRYLQAEGTSHAHLYLYREDGKLLRQLTSANTGQDFDPIFAPDGASIVFSREKSTGGAAEFWSVDPMGNDLKRVETAPDCYKSTTTSPFFGGFEPEPDLAATPTPTPDERAAVVEPPRTYRAPDDSVEIVVQYQESDDADTADGEGKGKHSLLRDLRSGQQTELGTLPGFFGLAEVFRLKSDPQRVFMFEGSLRLVFFGLHLNSTDGGTVFALDLNERRFLRLSPNGAAPVPLPGQSAFITVTDVRYVPIPGSKKTANCSYLEHWDEKLNKVRFARERTAALCYGASMYRPDDTPAIITLRRDAE